MGRPPKAQRKPKGGDAAASLPTPAAAASPPDLFTEDGLKASIVSWLERCEQGMASADSGSTEVKWAIEARHWWDRAAAVVEKQSERAEDQELLGAAARLEALLATGAARAGGADDPPFDAPET